LRQGTLKRELKTFCLKMKCKVFKIHLAEETRNFEEVKLNKFLDGLAVRQTFAEIVGNEYWSILVFYEDSSADYPVQTELQTKSTFLNPNPKSAIGDPQSEIRNPKSEIETPVPEPIFLTPEQEQKFNALKQWRNERAGQDGLPPYMVAHNESLMQIALLNIQTQEELTGVKGFGEKRAQKYGEEILKVLGAAK
jgi:superfamily II DNA helicase RecQ